MSAGRGSLTPYDNKGLLLCSTIESFRFLLKVGSSSCCAQAGCDGPSTIDGVRGQVSVARYAESFATAAIGSGAGAAARRAQPKEDTVALMAFQPADDGGEEWQDVYGDVPTMLLPESQPALQPSAHFLCDSGVALCLSVRSA